MHYPVPFYSNTSDNTHCFQACLKMIAKFFWPEREYSWDELDSITEKREGLWTWATAGLLWLQSNKVEIIDVELFDYELFAELGEHYLTEFYGEAIGKEQIAHGDIPHEQLLAQKALKKVKIIKQIPTLDDIVHFLDKGCLVLCNINAEKLNGNDRYAGHFVVVIGYDKSSFLIHDPGLPAFEQRNVPFDQFEEAWAYPNEMAKNLVALRKNEVISLVI